MTYVYTFCTKRCQCGTFSGTSQEFVINLMRQLNHDMNNADLGDRAKTYSQMCRSVLEAVRPVTITIESVPVRITIEAVTPVNITKSIIDNVIDMVKPAPIKELRKVKEMRKDTDDSSPEGVVCSPDLDHIRSGSAKSYVLDNGKGNIPALVMHLVNVHQEPPDTCPMTSSDDESDDHDDDDTNLVIVDSETDECV
jgi:hypothetical protein